MKPDGPVFDAQWRSISTIWPVPKTNISASDMLSRHYLRKWPAVVTLTLLLKCGDDFSGVIVFALPPRETNKRYGGETWELARLWVSDSLPKNSETYLIGQAVKYIKRNHKLVRCLVSYADPSAGHSGIIYKAANWKTDGKTDDGRKTPRFDYADAITGKQFSRKSHVPNGAEIVRVPRVSKHRFYYRML